MGTPVALQTVLYYKFSWKEKAMLEAKKGAPESALSTMPLLRRF